MPHQKGTKNTPVVGTVRDQSILTRNAGSLRFVRVEKLPELRELR